MQQKSIGPLKAIGVTLGTVTTVVTAVDNVVGQTSNLIDKSFEALNIPIDGGLEDLRTDEIVASAHRKVRVAKANAEAAAILAELDIDKGA